MKRTYFFVAFAFSFFVACNNDDFSKENKSDPNDSLSKARQREHNDSLKKKNPLLILPPDSVYTGDYVDKYPSGITKFRGQFRFGQKHGQWMSFYPSGLSWSELHFDKGIRQGPNITYFENGNKRYDGFYLNDMKDSIWNFYDSTGKLEAKIQFKRDHEVKQFPVK